MVYENRFTMPEAPGSQSVAGGYINRTDASGPFVGPNIKPLWYSYDHGPIHFLVYRCAALAMPYLRIIALARNRYILRCTPGSGT